MQIDHLEPRRLLSGGVAAKVTHSGVLQINGSSGADVISITIENGRIQTDAEGFYAWDWTFYGLLAGTKVKSVRVDLSGGNDKLYIKSDVRTFVEGKSGRDSITIDAAGAIVLGGSGNDTLRSIRSLLDPSFGDTVGFGEDGKPSRAPDTSFDIFLGSGNRIEGGPGDDVLYSRGGDDVLLGGSGFDRFIGASDDISIFNSEHYPYIRVAVVKRWPSAAMVMEVEQTELVHSERPVRAYF